ncbi:MAG: 3-oxoacyl-ACP synthase [Gammaproteobacteria bacterium]|nr:3-oxoacyl-ACP synthase [Gammaproteobacteria bacterium]
MSASPVWRDPRALSVLGMGIALPGPPLTTGALLDNLATRFHVDVRRAGNAIARRLGIQTRHVCRDFLARTETPRSGQRNADLATQALQSALVEADLGINDLDYLISHTATPGELIPPNVAQITELMGYRGPYVELRQACTGFANALVIARGLLDAPGARAVAIVGSETGSVYLDPVRVMEDRGQLVNLVQMGDAAAAIVLTQATPGSAQISQLFFGQIGYTQPAGFRIKAGGSDHLASDQALEFEHDFAAIRRYGVDLFEAGLAAAQTLAVDLARIDYVVPHQANGHLARLLAPRLHVEPRQIFVNADRLGNTGSAAIWTALAELRRGLNVGARVLILGAEATKQLYGGFCYVHA